MEALQYMIEKIIKTIENDQERKRILRELSLDEKIEAAQVKWLENISQGEDFAAEGNE